MSLLGKTILITGAASGNGLELTKEYLKKTEGNVKLILIDINAARLDELKLEYQNKYKTLTDDNIYASYGDLSSNDRIIEFFNKIPSHLINDLDILVNNAGLAKGLDRIGDIKQSDIDLMFNTNTLGLISLTQLVVPIFKKNDKGTVVNICSLAAEDPYPGGGAYCASKAAVKTFTFVLRRELINYNIRVVLITPGIIKTNFSNVRFEGDTDKANGIYKDYEPLDPADIADLVVYITSRRTNVTISEAIILPTHQATMSDKAWR
jgi:NADP-dependent 3-hydroxy acid dehydrogenase YdfG